MSPARGQLWWVDLGEPKGPEPGFRRPVLIVSDDRFNASRIATVNAVVLSTNLRLEKAPGNVLVPSSPKSGLGADSIVNVSQLVTLDKGLLDERLGEVSQALMKRVDAGLRLVLGLAP